VTSAGRATIVRFLVWVVAPIVLLAILRPWTVRPLESETPAMFDAATFVSTAWPKLMAEANDTATQIEATATPAPAKARFVKGVGRVTAIDRQSRVGVMRVQLVNEGPPVAIQIGPVIRGTALRDASSFIQFSDFTNQFEYAGAANALNEHALRTVVAPLPIDTMQGRVVSFVGAVGSSPRRDDGTIEVVLIRLGIGGEGAS
jgi:predicted lipoprotein